MVQSGDILVLSTDEKYKDCGDRNTIYVDYKKIVDACFIEDMIYIGDEAIPLKVTGKDSTYLIMGENTICNDNVLNVIYNHADFIWVSHPSFILLIFTVCLPFFPSRSSKWWQNWLKEKSHSSWKKIGLVSSPRERYKRPEVRTRTRS